MKRFKRELLGLRLLLPLLMALVLALSPGIALAGPTADVTVNATPAYVSISIANNTYSFGVVAINSKTNTTTLYFAVVNGSTVVTNNTVSVTGSNWTGGAGWIHSDTATPGVATVGMYANKGGTWGTDDVIVKYADPLVLAANQTATTDWSFGLGLWAPTEFTDGVLKENTVKISATQSG